MKHNGNRSVLIISPHPDDEAIGCGGLIMQSIEWKWNVYVLYMCVGSSRQFVTKSTTAKTRIPEIKKAAKFGKFDYSIVNRGRPFMRLDTLPQKKLIEQIENVVHACKPTIVTIPSISSYDQDHRAVAAAAITALRPLPLHVRHQPKFILSYSEPYLWDMGTSFSPNYFLDISAVMEEKIQLLACHASQMRKDPFARSPENLTRLAAFWGTHIGVKYAEGYQLLKGSLVYD